MWKKLGTKLSNRQTKLLAGFLVVISILLVGAVAFVSFAKPFSSLNPVSLTPQVLGQSSGNGNFLYQFSVPDMLEETGSMQESTSPYWWVNSGAFLYLSSGLGRTIFGQLPQGAAWQVKYNRANPVDTDNGTRPQNIFRLTTKEKWKNFRQQTYFRIQRLNYSSSPNRNASNGLLLFNRYVDGNNLYYAGIRVDGNAVIKKKKNGTYYTMAMKPLYPGSYSRDNTPNLLPVGQWIGIRVEVTSPSASSVRVRLLVDKTNTSNWQEVLSVVDTGSNFGGSAIVSEGYGGIRTDFMDVYFDRYEMVQL